MSFFYCISKNSYIEFIKIRNNTYLCELSISSNILAFFLIILLFFIAQLKPVFSSKVFHLFLFFLFLKFELFLVSEIGLSFVFWVFVLVFIRVFIVAWFVRVNKQLLVFWLLFLLLFSWSLDKSIMSCENWSSFFNTHLSDNSILLEGTLDEDSFARSWSVRLLLKYLFHEARGVLWCSLRNWFVMEVEADKWSLVTRNRFRDPWCNWRWGTLLGVGHIIRENSFDFYLWWVIWHVIDNFLWRCSDLIVKSTHCLTNRFLFSKSLWLPSFEKMHVMNIFRHLSLSIVVVNTLTFEILK